MGCLSSKKARANRQASNHSDRSRNERRQCHLQVDETSQKGKPCPWTSECKRQERVQAAKARNTSASCTPSCCRLPGCTHSKTSVHSRASHASCVSDTSNRSASRPQRPVSKHNSRNSLCCTCNCKPGQGKKANCACGKTGKPGRK